MEQKYYGILMVRQSVDPQIFVLKPKYVISGILRKECGEMKLIDDMNGSYYLSDDVCTIFYEVETSVAYLITEDELKSKYPKCTISEARAKYFEDICKSVHFYSIDSVSDSKIHIISIDLLDFIAKKHKGQPTLLDEVEEPEEKKSLSELLERVNGDEIVAMSMEELKSIINLGSYEEIKKRLQKVYDDTVELNNHFLGTNSSKKTSINSTRILNGDSIIEVFTVLCDEVQSMDSISEIKSLFKSVEEIWMNLITILEKRGGQNADDCAAANDFLYRLIDCFDDIAKLNDLDVIKHEIRELKDKEMINIKQTAKIFDKYKEIFEQQRNSSKPIQSSPAVLTTSKPTTILKAREMKQFLDRKVVGQEEAKKDVISAIIMNSLSDDPNDRTACLLIGPTGSGKTLIISTISQYLDKPVEIIDSTQLTVPGYVGANIEDYLSNLIDKAGGDVKSAEEGIVAFDEIDKKGTEKNGDVSGRGVLNTLLSFIQGTTYQVKYNGKIVQFNTSKLTVFATGAFTEVVKQLSGSSGSYKSTSIGFSASQSSKKEEDIKYPELTIQDLVKYGNMPEELLGRISTVTQLTGHTKESLRKILLESESSTLLAEQNKLAKLGVQLKWTDGFVDALIEQALKLKTGGRSLKSAVEKAIKEARWTILENFGEYSCIVLGAKTVRDHLECTLIDINGQSHSLKDLRPEEAESAKVKQKTALE